MPSRVALVQGTDRYKTTRASLELLAADLDLASRERIVVKPNFVTVYVPLAVTHGDTMRAVLDVLMDCGVHKITLAEGPAIGSFKDGLRRFGYNEWLSRYPVDLVDLNADDSVPFTIYDKHLRPVQAQVARTVAESDFRISVGPIKTHDTVVMTASIKNYGVGSLPRRNKKAIHRGYPAININLCRLAQCTGPHLAVLDGIGAMEGDGPTGGTPAALGAVIASADAVAADGLACYLMGIDPHEVGYLHYCDQIGLGHVDLDQMEIVGGAHPEELRHPFRLHRNVACQAAWRVSDAERFLTIS